MAMARKQTPVPNLLVIVVLVIIVAFLITWLFR